MRAVILVPRRSGFPERDRLWAYVKQWWQENLPGIDIVEGHHDHGLFNRAAAINTAARKAGAWDVALIIDSDVILDEPQQAHDAALAANETGRLVVAFELRNNLSRISTEHMLAGHAKNDWSTGVERVYKDQHSSVIAVPISLWETVGGFDENFRGWGFEDTGFAIAADTFTGPRIHLPGVCWHLWHPQAPEKAQSPARLTNWNRAQRYRDANGDQVALRAILNEGVEPTSDLTIPKILHRVVPEQTTAQVELWWEEFGRLHPDWRLMTWRDPIDPAKFPYTSPYWGRVKAGAQLADLVRMEALSQWGGVYVDSDMQPFRPLDPLCQAQGFAAYEDGKIVPNAVMGFRRGHPAVQACLEMMVERMNGTGKVWQCGPGVTTSVLIGRDDVLLLPPESFYPVYYRDEDRDQKMREFDPEAHPWTYAMHWYAGSWLAKEKQHDLRDDLPAEPVERRGVHVGSGQRDGFHP